MVRSARQLGDSRRVTRERARDQAELRVRVVLRVDLDVLAPLVRELVLGETGVHRAGLDAGVAVDALVGIDEELLGGLVVGLVGRRVDAVDGTDLDARVVLLSDAGLGDDVGHGWFSPSLAASVVPGIRFKPPRGLAAGRSDILGKLAPRPPRPPK